MQLTGNTLLITGGSSGIGLALAARFAKLGNEVLICGRGETALAEAKNRFPSLHPFVADVGSPAAREALFANATRRFPKLNVLISNAGIQHRVSLVEPAPWAETSQEIAVNLEAPIHLAMLFVSHLAAQEHPVIANVSSGLGFVPAAGVPIYSATKAALHSFTQSLRHQLRDTPIDVVEIIPPAVRTNLGGAHDFGVPLDDYADAVMAQLAEGRREVTYGTSATSSQASRSELDARFRKLNGA